MTSLLYDTSCVRECDAIKGFDAIKEARQWRDASVRRILTSTPEEQAAFSQKALEEHAARRAALLREAAFAH